MFVDLISPSPDLDLMTTRDHQRYSGAYHFSSRAATGGVTTRPQGRLGSMTSSGSLVLFSGGLDSAVCLSFAQHQGGPVLAVLFDYGQKSRVEIERAHQIAGYLDIELLVVSLDLSLWGGSSLFASVGDSAEHTTPVTDYVPARNLIFLSIATGIAEARNLSTIYLGANASEQTFRDARPEFLTAMQHVVDQATVRGAGQDRIKIRAPLAALGKEAVVRAGMNYGTPLHLSWSCYEDGDRPCGVCQSCLQRSDAFAAVGHADPLLTAVNTTASITACREQHVTEPDIVHIVGNSSSGSTALALFLEEHPQVVAAGELAGIGADRSIGILCSCGFQTSACGFWAGVLAGIDSASPIFDQHNGASSETIDRYLRDSCAVLNQVGWGTDSAVVIDTSKQPNRAELLCATQPSRVIHLVRDGRSLIDSFRRRQRADWPVAKIAQHWVGLQRRCETLRASLGDRARVVRYEDWASDPLTTRDEFVTWFGLDPATQAQQVSERHHLRGSTCRFEKLNVAVDDGWKKRVDTSALREFEAIAGPTLQSYGYPLEFT